MDKTVTTNDLPQAVNNATETPVIKAKRKRRFKRKFLQPQPKRSRKRRDRHHNEQTMEENVPEGWNGIVKNISGEPVTKIEESLFLKGKKFCPVEKDPPFIRMQRELNTFFRHLRIQWHFRGQKDGRSELEKKFYPKSNWTPPKACVEIENFISKMQEKFDRWKPQRYVKDNLSYQERQFLQKIKTDDKIVYMWEDKGSSFVKMTKQQYLEAGKNELGNRDVYEEIADDTSKQIKTKSDIIADSLIQKNEVPLKVGEFLKGGKFELSKFYHIVKTHKIPPSLDDPKDWIEENGFPLRGIISGCGSPTERLAGYVDYILQPGMKNLPSYLKDTIHTLQILEETNKNIQEGRISLEGVGLVSLDLEAMYNNMSEELGTGACRDFLLNRTEQGGGDDNYIPTTNSVLAALELCLKNNYFQFDDKIYKQKRGVGTGIKLAPTYACIGVGKYEEMLFSSDQALLQKILLWKRFIDDVLMLFRGTKEECQNLVTWLNSLVPGTIKFKFDFSYEKINFLDLEIYIEDGLLMSNLFVKPTNSQLFLDFGSNHPEHCKKAIPYSQALRVIERCSTIENRDEHLATLKVKFEERNYPSELISAQFDKAQKKDRKELLSQDRKKKKSDENKVRLIFTHNQANPPIHMWLRDCKRSLERNDLAKEIGNRIQIAHRQPKNLQKIVGGCKSGSGEGNNLSPNPGCTKCGKCRVLCPKINETKFFESTATQKKYTIKQSVNCNSDWVIYLGTCLKCKGQYVGKSKTVMKIRHSNHKQEIKKLTGGLGHHYGGQGGCGYENLTLTIIEQVEEKNLKFLAEREVYWQHQLRVFLENGYRNHCRKKEI